jgi:hypothetical protein
MHNGNACQRHQDGAYVMPEIWGRGNLLPRGNGRPQDHSGASAYLGYEETNDDER